MYGFKKGENREEKIDLFLDNAAWFYSTKQMMDHTANAVNKLTDELKEAGKSSERLTEALNRISLWGVRVAVAGVVVAVLTLIFEVIKYFIS